MSTELVVAQERIKRLEAALRNLDEAFCSDLDKQANRFAARKALIAARALLVTKSTEAEGDHHG